MVYGMKVLGVRFCLSLESRAGAVGTFECEGGGVSWTRLLRSEFRISILQQLRIANLFNRSL